MPCRVLCTVHRTYIIIINVWRSASKCAALHIGDDEGQKRCDQSANLQDMMANMNGCTAYDAAQSAACDCVEVGDGGREGGGLP